MTMRLRRCGMRPDDAAAPGMDHACKDGLYLVQRGEGGNDRCKVTSSALPTGFSEAVEHVGVLFWPKPRWPIADLKLERGRRDRDRLL